MQELSGHSLLILGRQPELGLAELESLYGAANVKKYGDQAAIIALPAEEIDFERIGGSIKLAKVLHSLPPNLAQLEKWLVSDLASNLPASGKFSVGLSLYGFNQSPNDINRLMLAVKKAVRTKTGKSIRVVPNKQAALGSAQIIHNNLTGSNGREYVAVDSQRGLLVGQTVAEQDIEAYGARDQARPKRDATVGMLPPKLAQIIINLANPAAAGTVLDPFCGTGVILQEALLMGFNTVGTDLEQRMVDYSKENVDWLRAMASPLPGDNQVAVGDATEFTWPQPIDAVASETYLGRPLTALPKPEVLKQIIRDVDTILGKFLKNLAPQLKSDTPLCLAIPAWRNQSSFSQLPLIEHLTDMGYTIREFKHAPEQLVYWREGQVVGRRLLVINKI